MQADSVMDLLRSTGLRVDGFEATGAIVRVPVNEPAPDKGGKKSGWYVLHELVLQSGAVTYVGACGNYKQAEDSVRIGVGEGDLSPVDREESKRKQQEAMEASRREREDQARRAAEKANEMWPRLGQSGKSKYLQRKGVRPYGVRFAKGAVVVPLRRIDGDLVGLQFIDGQGNKRFLTGTPKQGAFHLIGAPEQGGRLAVAEGYATAADVHEALEIPVAVAFDAGNLQPVAESLQEKFSPALILVAGDDDPPDQHGRRKGIEKAQSAAQAVGGVALFPSMPGGGSDVA